VPDAWVLAVGEGYLHAWNEQTAGERADHAETIAFTACRVWRFAVERRHCAKSDAAAWVLERAPDLDAVRIALQSRYRPRPKSVYDAALLRLLAAAREGVAAARRLESVRHPE
jgi:hypothetical protein